MTKINAQIALQLLSKKGYLIKKITEIPEGSNHYVFDIILSGGKSAICKFSKKRYTEQGLIAENTDSLFGGKLSLEREVFLYTLVKDTVQLPAPKVYGIHKSQIGNFILVEKMPGQSHKEYIAQKNFAAKDFLASLKALGRDIAKVHRTKFSSFGNIMADGNIEPSGILNFSDRFLSIMEMRINLAERKGALTGRELEKVKTFFAKRFKDYRTILDINNSPSVLVFTDMHSDNFFVDDYGIPCGYFDLESCQAAPAALEFYGLRFFIFNYFNQEIYEQAEEAFLEGYIMNGGHYFPKTSIDHEVIDLLSACRLLELTESYWGYIDGLRDTWGQRIKTLLFDYMASGKIDYIALGDIFRERDGQPRNPIN